MWHRIIDMDINRGQIAGELTIEFGFDDGALMNLVSPISITRASQYEGYL